MTLLEVSDAVKRYGAVAALDGASLAVEEGEIVALLGDNGAGKSTLIKAISGVHRLDQGEIRFGGHRASFRSPMDARHAGIEAVFQDLALFDNLSVVQNFFIGRELRRPRGFGRLGVLERGPMRRSTRDAVDGLGVRIDDLRASVGLLSGGQRQSIAVARAVAFANRLVVLDEPTAALGVRESGQVLELVSKLPAAGASVIVVSHNLEHVLQVADRAVVLRRGKTVGSLPATADRRSEIVSLIVGGGRSARAE
jgi:D-xylose transport system ATP-binding protein